MISLDRTYTTRHGLPVKILMTDGGGIYPVMGATLMGDTGVWEPDRWRADGSYVGDGKASALDLVEVGVQRSAAE